MPTHPRSPSPSPSKPSKKLRSGTADPQPLSVFFRDVLSLDNVQRLSTEYSTSQPFKYALVEQLFDDGLLKDVKDEYIQQLSFTEKQTDIYKVNQTGDLASLSYLSPEQINVLPSLLQLRDALYSAPFRAFLRSVTGCAALSGTKQDMSVNSYTQGCHLLNHDDVIGTRRVSYILYMPLPYGEKWQPEWGGALELYPVNQHNEPQPVPEKNIPPSWNQFIFFEVQPGKSFHSVEEVVVDEGEEGRARLSISGWFHAAQADEEGYEADDAEMKQMSSREQLTAEAGPPLTLYTTPIPHPDSALTVDQRSFLSAFLAPAYLHEHTLQNLADTFGDESQVQLHQFLCTPLADKLEAGLRELDLTEKLGGGRIPSYTTGVGGDEGWVTKGPPHKHRYCTLAPSSVAAATLPTPALQSVNELLHTLECSLFPSEAFRQWLARLSSMVPLAHGAEVRRFRPGLDYTLAGSTVDARLDVVLGLTPGSVKSTESKGPDKLEGESDDSLGDGWKTGEWGGWECYMAPHDEEDDPAVYRSGSSKSSKDPTERAKGSGPKSYNGGLQDVDVDIEDEEDGEDDDSTLLTVQPGFNHLLLVLRDVGVMRFVKYVSAMAEGSRWDVCGEYDVGMIDVEEED